MSQNPTRNKHFFIEKEKQRKAEAAAAGERRPEFGEKQENPKTREKIEKQMEGFAERSEQMKEIRKNGISSVPGMAGKFHEAADKAKKGK